MAARPYLDAAAEPQSLDAVLDWNRELADALVDRRAAVLLAARAGAAVPARYVGMTPDGVAAHFDARRDELDRLTVLNLVACAEARLRIDYLRRVHRRLKDRLSKAYRKWRKSLPKKQRKRPKFEGDNGLLRQLQRADALGPDGKQRIDEFRACLPPRHWVAHGRYWDKPIGIDRHPPEDVHRRADALLRALP